MTWDLYDTSGTRHSGRGYGRGRVRARFRPQGGEGREGREGRGSLLRSTHTRRLRLVITLNHASYSQSILRPAKNAGNLLASRPPRVPSIRYIQQLTSVYTYIYTIMVYTV